MATTTKTTAKKSAARKSAAKKTPARTLLVVESPSKAKIISKYLGSRYKVMASVGHVRDLPKSRLGVDVENNLIAIKGAVPGPKGGVVIITNSIKKS